MLFCNLYCTLSLQFRLQISAIRVLGDGANPTDMAQPKVIIAIVIINLKLWPAAGCEAKVKLYSLIDLQNYIHL